jgi:4-hydroxybenzoyl-CoA thioesterase
LPFGLVYYPRIVAWFNDTEHELFRIIGYPIEQMIKNDRTTFVMGEIHFRFIGPAAYGDHIVNTITLADVGARTLHWNCKAKNAVTGAPVSEGKATRVYARINEDGSLSSQVIPVDMLTALKELREPDAPQDEQRRDEARRRPLTPRRRARRAAPRSVPGSGNLPDPGHPTRYESHTAPQITHTRAWPELCTHGGPPE